MCRAAAGPRPERRYDPRGTSPDRDALIEDDPHTYYLKPHSVAYACVLVRLRRVSVSALRDLVTDAHPLASTKTRKAPAIGSRRGVGRPSSSR